MAIAVLGYGKIGRAIVKDLENSMPSEEIAVFDPYAKETGKGNLRVKRVDPLSPDTFRHIAESDLVMAALPAEQRPALIGLTLRYGARVVDVTFGNDDPFSQQATGNRKSLYIPDCGLAPGLSNMAAGYFHSVMDETEDLKIYVGGIPERPVPPLDYVITFASQSVIDEYVNSVTWVSGGQVRVDPALSGTEEFHLSGFPFALEAFLTDGLRTLLRNVRVKNTMFEKTIRYMGHSDKVMLLRDLGFFSSDAVDVAGYRVRPRDLTAALFDSKLRAQGVRDMIILRVTATGTSGGRRVHRGMEMIHVHRKDDGLTSMSVTTAAPACAVAELLLGEDLDLHGVVCPEELAMKAGVFGKVAGALRRRGIELSFSES